MDFTIDITTTNNDTTTINFNDVVKMESQYQIKKDDAYIVQFKNGVSLFISKDDSDYWYYQSDQTADLQNGDEIIPQSNKFQEIVSYI